MVAESGSEISPSGISKGRQKGLALITGAAHRIGREIALAFAARGYAIGLHYHRSQENARRTAGEIESLGAPVVLLSADLTDDYEIQAMFQRLSEANQPLTVLVNSAAVMERGDLRTMTSQEWDQTLALNLRAPWLCAREAAVLMKANGGNIINISDTGANQTWTGYPAYQVSKSAVETLTRLLAKTLAPAIRVNAVAPGLILKSPQVSEEEWQRLVKKLPLRRAGSVDSVVSAILFLLENEYITGQTIVVDGGYRLV